MDVIEYNGFRIEIFFDEHAENPLTEYDTGVTLVLQEQAERHFGWSTDKDWVPRLQEALEKIRRHGVVKNLYGPGGALSIVNRWLKVAHGMPVVMPVSAYEHSGVLVYLGNANHWSDPQGWDSGWIGWLLVTADDRAKIWGDMEPVKILEGAKAAFDEFAAWVCGDVAWYRILDPDRVEIDLEGRGTVYCANDAFSESGWERQEAKDAIDAHIATRKEPA